MGLEMPTKNKGKRRRLSSPRPSRVSSGPCLCFLLTFAFLGFRVFAASQLVLGFGFGERDPSVEVVLFVGIHPPGRAYRMEGKKTTASIADDLFGQKEATSVPKSSSSSSSSSSSGYFSSVFPPASSVMAKDSARSDLYGTLDKQRTEGHIGNAQSSRAGEKYQGSPSKNHTSNKDGKSAYPTESIESPYFGSSVHYGGREFYSSTPSMRSSGAPNSYKNKDEDDSGDSNVATRGDWWQGSLYY